MVEHIGLAYEDDIDEALDILETAAADLDVVLEEPRVRAYVHEFGGDAVIVRVHFWIERPRDRNIFRVRSAFARSVKRRFADAGITISPPSKRDLLGRIEVDNEP